MTIPSRPAPAPPGSRGQSATASANASIEQLRLQLQQQQQHQQQNGGIQKLTIKLPPPPKGPHAPNGYQQQPSPQKSSNNNNNGTVSSNSSSSITRRFPQARYSPATDWDDAPFNAAANGNFKKVPPPRPPPPKVEGRKATAAPAPPQTQASILSNLFQRKKTSANAQKGASRVYGVSSGVYGSTTVGGPVAKPTTATSNSGNGSGGGGGGSVNWNDNWSAAASNYTAFASHTSSSTHMIPPEPQLISFDSPPSSPTFTQKSNSDCVSVDSFSSDSNFSSPNNGSVSQPESGFEDDFSAAGRSRPSTTTPLDPWETLDGFGGSETYAYGAPTSSSSIGTAPVRNLNTINTRIAATNDNPLCNGKSLLPPPPSMSMPTIIKPKISQKPKAPKPPMFGKPFSASAATLDADLPTPPSPPMPQCAPPPPPGTAAGSVSLLDVISGKVDAIHLNGGAYYADEAAKQPYGIALYNFDGTEEGDLNFRENDKIYLLEKVSEDWYRGRTRAGCEGIFPGNYIDIQVPLAATAAEDTTPASYPSAGGFGSGNTASQNATKATKVRCLYNFPAEVDGDLALKESDMVTIICKINEDWLFGEIDGRQGQFPANFLEYLPDNIPMS